MLEKLEEKYNASFYVALFAGWFGASNSIKIDLAMTILNAFASSEGDPFDISDFLFIVFFTLALSLFYIVAEIWFISNSVKINNFLISNQADSTKIIRKIKIKKIINYIVLAIYIIMIFASLIIMYFFVE